MSSSRKSGRTPEKRCCSSPIRLSEAVFLSDRVVMMSKAPGKIVDTIAYRPAAPAPAGGPRQRRVCRLRASHPASFRRAWDRQGMMRRRRRLLGGDKRSARRHRRARRGASPVGGRRADISSVAADLAVAIGDRPRLSGGAGLFMRHLGFYARHDLLGFVLAVVLGVALAVGIVYSRFLERTAYTLLVALNSIPKVALAPLFVIWMGTGPEPKIAIALDAGDLSDRHRYGARLALGRSRYVESGAGIEGLALGGADQNSFSLRVAESVRRHEGRRFPLPWSAPSSASSLPAAMASDFRSWWRRASSIPSACSSRCCCSASSARYCSSWSTMPNACAALARFAARPPRTIGRARMKAEATSRGTLALIATAALWGSNHVAGRSVREMVPLPALVFWRWVPAAIILTIIAWPALRQGWPAIRAQTRRADRGWRDRRRPVFLLPARRRLPKSRDRGRLHQCDHAGRVLLLGRWMGEAPLTAKTKWGVALAFAGTLLIVTKGKLRDADPVSAQPR